MPVLIGVDEAGYGPNYGPLCVAASAWRVAHAKAESPERKADGKSAGGLPDLYRLLRKAVVRTPDKAGKKLAVADSKALYSAGAGLVHLERGVLASLLAIDSPEHGKPVAGDGASSPAPVTSLERVHELFDATGADPGSRRAELACHIDDEQSLPVESTAEEICRLADRLRTTCIEKGVRLLGLRARLVYPAEFNELIEYFGSKGAALSHVTLALVRQVVDRSLCDGSAAAAVEKTDPCLTPLCEGERRAAAAPSSARGSCGARATSAPMEADPRAEPGAAMGDSVLICLDKHGGRSRYAALVQHHFPECWIEPVSENRNRSRYRWTHGGRPMEAVFRVGCEELLPTALASMTAKYHRELAMRAFNAFWTARLPELRPTAGYPNDSHRFREAIAAVQNKLGIDDRLVWRSR